MIKYTILATTAILLSSAAVAQSIVDRAETAELRRNSGTSVPRVERDKEGHVTSLILSDMKLSPEEGAELPELKHLRRLVLFRTNFSDRDLEHLERCKSLEHLNLTSTNVTDVAVDSILKLSKLKTLCLGNVNITPQAIDKLKVAFRTRDREIKWRYTQRRTNETESSAGNADVQQGSESTESKTDKQTAFPPSRVDDGSPPWLKEYAFKTAKFTFVRMRCTEPAGRWSTGYPDADINLSDRVKQLTRLEVSPDGLVMDIADPKLAGYPFAYLSANGMWQLSDEDATALRGYLNAGRRAISRLLTFSGSATHASAEMSENRRLARKIMMWAESSL